LYAFGLFPVLARAARFVISLRELAAGQRPSAKDSPMLYRTSSPATRVIVAPSDDEVKRTLTRFQPVLGDGPVPVRGRRIGWKKTNAGPLGAIFVNELTGRRTLWVLDFQSRRPRQLAVLT
jgi:hypothetical protein